MPGANARIPLPQVAHEVLALTGQPPPKYRQIYNAALDGRIPAEQACGRWSVARSDLPVIAEKLGLVVIPAPRARGRSRNEPAEPIAA